MASPAEPVQPGFIIASPQLKDPNFERTLVLLCQHDEEGALGLVINREGPISLDEVLSSLGLPTDPSAERTTWWGGPVGPGAGFVLFAGEVGAEQGWSLAGQIAISPSMEQLQRLVHAGLPFELCLGYAGWGPGQLEHEITHGSWLFTDLDPSLVFEAPLEERYDRALASLGLTASEVWMAPFDE